MDAPVSLAILVHVQQLFVRAAREAYVTVPAKVSWQKFGLLGNKEMEVTFDDIDTFATTVKNCAFSSRYLAAPCLFRLCLAMAESGIPWESFRDEDGLTTLAFPTVNVGYVCKNIYSHIVSVEPA